MPSPSAGQCAANPVTGIAGSIYTAFTSTYAGISGALAAVTTEGDAARNAFAAISQSIADAIVAYHGGSVSGDYVPNTRQLSGTAPIRIDGGASADLSASRTISITNGTGLVVSAGALAFGFVGEARGGIPVRSSTDWVVLPIGTSGKVLKSDGTDVTWATLTAADVGAVATSRTLTATSPVRIDGGASADLSSNRTLSVLDAGAAQTGVVTTGAQTLGGTKTFNGGVVIAPAAAVTGAAELTLEATSTNYVAVRTNATERARIGDDGGVTIGTTAALGAVGLGLANGRRLRSRNAADDGWLTLAVATDDGFIELADAAAITTVLGLHLSLVPAGGPYLFGDDTGWGIATDPAPSAVFDVASTTQGARLCPMADNDMNLIGSPADGLLVYNTDHHRYYWWDDDAAAWTAMGGGGGVPTGRVLTTTDPLQIDGGASADLSADRTLSILDAGAAQAGIVSTGAQAFAGVKTFNDDVHMADVTSIVGDGDLTISAVNEMVVGSPNVHVDSSTVVGLNLTGLPTLALTLYDSGNAEPNGRRARIEKYSAVTNTAPTLLELCNSTSGTPAAGIGAGLSFRAMTAVTPTESEAARLTGAFSAVGTPDGYLQFDINRLGTVAAQWRMSAGLLQAYYSVGAVWFDALGFNGNVSLGSYGTGTNVLGLSVVVDTASYGDPVYIKNGGTTGVTIGNGQAAVALGLRSTRTVPGAYPYTTLVTDSYVAVTSTASARTINLAAAASYGAGAILEIADESGGAGTNNITIDADGTELIDGATTKVISTNYGSARLRCTGTGWQTIGSSAASVSGYVKADGTVPLTADWPIGAHALKLTEMSAPGTPSANELWLYVKDNGSGKTQLCVKGSDGTEGVLWTQA